MFGKAFDGLFSGLMIFGGIIGAIVIALIWGIWALFFKPTPNEIRSETLIKPRIELVIVDNKVDTIYVYNGR